MKNHVWVVLFSITLGLAFPSLLKAQTNNPTATSPIDTATVQALDASRADSPTLTVPQNSTEYAVEAVGRTEKTGAGAPTADAKDMKSLTAPSIAAAEDQGFSEPSVYAEYKFSQIQDKRPAIGLDGPEHNAIAGFDFESYWKTIVGFNFTYTNEDLSANGGPGFANLENSSESYFFSPYIARNFWDWVNVGFSFTYGRTDTEFRSTLPFYFGQNTTQDSYAYSPFVGLAHTWGAFSFSSTPTYIYGYNHYEFDAPQAPGAAPTPPDAKTTNQTFLWLNNFQYAVTDKLSLSVQANWTHILSNAFVATPGLPPPSFSRDWMSFGGRADYSFNKNGSIFAAFEHDAFNVDFDNYRIRTGVTYNF